MHASTADDTRAGPVFIALVRRLWALPWSAAGLLLAALPLLGGARARIVNGVVEVSGGPLAALRARPGQGARFAAVTLGHVVLGVDAATLQALRRHEHAHVRQYERWGPLFVPAYLASSAWAGLRGGHVWFDNAFERQARAAEAADLPPFDNDHGVPR